ncbi:TetR/AcrR family transcriptional regulator [Nocardia nova]|uniref:Putative transcriptional regulator, TetR family n=1 Tax=Nocardia nova SH22a TaxID=1415166 RepID=W5THI6_9NOCA|nr:TetR/AcrR family transcriptional regulator [Nocardia nova]AHH18692.1 putative transcriptional regulator, TetR family [Nocardia nova SH22a]
MSAEDRREQILDVTHAIVDTEGFHAATPNRIAEAAGVTRPVLYQQFGDLAGVFVALIDRESTRAATQFAQAVLEPETSADTDPFVRAFAGALHAIDTRPATWRLFLLPPEGAPPELHQRLAQSQDAVRQFLEHELLRAFPDLPDPEYMARILHASGRELLQQRLVDPDNATNDRLIALVRHLRNGTLPGRRTTVREASV